MRLVWNALNEAGLGDGSERQRDFGRMIKQVRKMLTQPDVPQAFRALASEVVEATHQAHLYRRDLVHDLLVEAPWRHKEARSAFGAHPPRLLAEISSAAMI
jgi:hypothetical protein